MSANTLILIIIFFTVGKINKINPKINPINAIVKSTDAKIVIVVILLNFLIVIAHASELHREVFN